jgi:hypothetical protein
MRRFAQKADEISPEILEKFGKEDLEKFKYSQKVEEYRKSEAKMFQFCEDLKSIGSEMRSTASSINSSDPFLITAKAGLLVLSNKLIEIGNDAEGAIKAKNDTIFGLGVGAALTSTYQPSAKIKTPSAKRFIPFAGDVVNFAYTLNLKPSDFTDAIKTIFSSYECSKDHPDSKAPLFSGIYPNFKDHPELDDQHRNKFEAFSSLALNIGALIQNVEAALALIATITGHFEFVAAVRIAGGAVQTVLNALSILFSPNTYDIFAYGNEGFEGGGFDKSSPLSILNVTRYPQLYEAKPIAEEGKEAKERRVQNFILNEIDFENKEAVITDTLGDLKILTIGEKWPKWNITLTGIFSNHVEVKDSSGHIYSIVGIGPNFSNKDIYDQLMKEAANLSASGVKGDVTKLMSKKMSFIMSLVYQLKNKYPWIGDRNNKNWINLQSDILAHVIRPEKKRNPTPKPAASTPKPTTVPNLREISIDNYKQQYFREDQSQLIPERRGSAVKVKLLAVMEAIKSGTLSQMNWDNWSDIGKQAIIEEAIDRLQNAGYNIINPPNARMTRVPPISKYILDQLSPKYKSLR